ncbi:DoxX family protein [Tunturibacter empetritectus]|uniref:Thiosulfate dehydrogenase [quinone] large subunit n=1 Tax=Tunturiibacter empetritectus TaxID=3069691 RepID=A0A7W8IHJ2_9BACT|nr:DoxX family membrane protein [Edaphobacter lichenicola]MBB5316431.1 thiosulfate dehydrogenase [quinone] large subunit [Edaphobacter lichenicola]
MSTTAADQQSNQQSKALAFLRISVALLFLIFAEYKLVNTKFIWGGLAHDLGQLLNEGSYPFIRPLLKNIILPHSVLFAAVIAISELLIALSLLSGVLVRWASLGGLTMMLLFLFTSNYPGPNSPFWLFFGASLDNSVLALCFIAFLISPPHQRWTLRRPKQ